MKKTDYKHLYKVETFGRFYNNENKDVEALHEDILIHDQNNDWIDSLELAILTANKVVIIDEDYGKYDDYYVAILHKEIAIPLFEEEWGLVFDLADDNVQNCMADFMDYSWEHIYTKEII